MASSWGAASLSNLSSHGGGRDPRAAACGDAQLRPVLDTHADARRLVSTRSQRFGEALSLTYHVSLKDVAGVDKLVRDLAEIEGVERVEAIGVADAAE